MKNVLIKIRTSLKFFILVSIATFLIIGAVILLYKPIYSVTLNGELVGYCAQKSKLQARIDDFVENQFELNRVFQVINGTVEEGKRGPC